MSDIYIRLNNEDADITNADLISSGDVDTVEVHFSFSEEWNEFPVKTMCVHTITQDEENKIGTNFIGITSEGLSVVPQGALAKPGRLFIAVVGENPNGKILTSTWVTLKIRRGADFLVEDDDVDVLGRLMPAGGNEGDILVKNSDENFDYTWKPSSESLEAGLNISIIDKVISSNCFREVEELPEVGIAGVIYILDNTESPDVEGVFTWDASSEQYISFGKSYTAGNNITISEQGVISATDTTYTAGNNIQISNENVISATDTTYTAGQNIQINNNNEISATDTTYSAGNGLDLNSENVFKADNIIICDALPQIADAVERDVYALTYIKDAKWLPKTGLPSQYQTEQAYDAWLDDGHTATIFKTSYGAQNAADCILVEDLPPFEIVDDEVYLVDRLADLSGLQIYAIALNIEQTDVVWRDYGTTQTPAVNGLIISAKEDNKRFSATQSGGLYTATFDYYFGEYSGIVYSDQLAYKNNNLFYSPANNQWNLYEPRTLEPHTYVKLYIFDGEKYIYVTDSNLSGHVTSSDINLDEFKRYAEETYALRKYYGNENVNLGNTSGTPANAYASGSTWNISAGTGNSVDGDSNEVLGINNTVDGDYNIITGAGLNIDGNYNIATGPIMPVSKKLVGSYNFITAYGNDVQGNENAIFGLNNKVRGNANLSAGHDAEVTGNNNISAGEYARINGNNNAVFGIGYGNITGNSNLSVGMYPTVTAYDSSTASSQNIIGGYQNQVAGINNLIIGEYTSNNSYKFAGDTEATTFNHVYGHDNIYSGSYGSISGHRNLYMCNIGKIYGLHNIVSGEHQNVKGSFNYINGTTGDTNIVGSKNIIVTSGSQTTLNMIQQSLLFGELTNCENINHAIINAFYSNFTNAHYINAYGYGLKYTGTLDNNDNPTNAKGLTIIGQWNEDNNDRDDYVFIVGGGSSDGVNRKNVFTITKDGYVTCKVSDDDTKHKILGSACVVDGLPLVGQQNTIYVLIADNTESTESTEDIEIAGLYIWHEPSQAYYEISTGGGATYLAGNGIDITDSTISSKIKTSNSGLTLDSNGLSVDTTVIQPKLTAGANVTIDPSTNTISATGGSSLTAGTGIEINTDNEICADNIHVVNALPSVGVLEEIYAVPFNDDMFVIASDLPTELTTSVDFEDWYGENGTAIILKLNNPSGSYYPNYTYLLFFNMQIDGIGTDYYEVKSLHPTEDAKIFAYDAENEYWYEILLSNPLSIGDKLIAMDSDSTSGNNYILDSEDYAVKTNVTGITCAYALKGIVWIAGTCDLWADSSKGTAVIVNGKNNPFDIWEPPTRTLNTYIYTSEGYEQLSGGSGGTAIPYEAGNGLELNTNVFSVKTPSNSGLIVNNNGVSVDTTAIQTKLTAGSNISISSGTISATDTTYSAGNGISLTGTSFAVKTKLSDSGLTLDSNGLAVDPTVIQTKLTAGSGISITNGVISVSYPNGDNIEY